MIVNLIRSVLRLTMRVSDAAKQRYQSQRHLPNSPMEPSTQEHSIGIGLSVPNLKAIDWAKAHAAERTQDIDEDVRLKIRDLVTRAVAAGEHPITIAKEIAPWLKLNDTEIQQAAVYREELLAKGYKNTRLEKAVLRYRQKSLNDRSHMIARTEMMSSFNHGQQQYWDIAASQGFLNPDVTWQVWIGTPDEHSCEQCSRMNGKRARINEPFQTPLGPIQGPPLHDGCRCCMGLVFDRGLHPLS